MPSLEKIVADFARLTDKDLPSAIRQVEKILDYVLFNYPKRGGQAQLSASYQRIANYNHETLNDDEEQLARYFRIAISMGSHIVAKGWWMQETELPAQLLEGHLKKTS